MMLGVAPVHKRKLGRWPVHSFNGYVSRALIPTILDLATGEMLHVNRKKWTRNTAISPTLFKSISYKD